jgi:threonine/homoserine/homoserine lactone efflux protein
VLVNLPAFLGVAAVVIMAPGPDTAIVTKNALLHGRRAALGTAFGVQSGLVVWTLACALGLAAVIRASAVGFSVLKLAGAAYLIWLGLQAFAAARRPRGDGVATEPDARTGHGRSGRRGGEAARGFRQGISSNLANPKIAVFFTGLLPQFVSRRTEVLFPSLLLGGLFVLMTVIWLVGWALLAARASEALRRPAVKRTMDCITGSVLVGFGLRLATEHR